MDESKDIVLETIFDRCPVCQTGRVQNLKPTGLFGFTKANKISCEYCHAIFIEQGTKEEERAFKLDLIESIKQNKYAGQTLKKSEWIRGSSDFDLSLKNNELPDYTIKGLNLVLLENETTHYYAKTKLHEEKALRVYIGGGGKYLRGGVAESFGQVKEIDKGELILTNQRLIFYGYARTIEYKLPKIISVVNYDNGVAIASKNKSKMQFYLLDEPYKCSEYIKLAIKLCKEKKDIKKAESENKAFQILKERYATGEITKEEYEQMKKDIEE